MTEAPAHSSPVDTPVADTPVAVVTGAARGIGLATTELFLDQGWRVVMVDRDGDELTRAAAALTGVHPITADVSMPEQVDRMAAEAQAVFGRVDALVNNAGVALFSPAGQTSFDGWREVMGTNLDGVFLCTQALSDALAERGGAIVNIASISGLRASTLRVAYGTSKAAVIHMTKHSPSSWANAASASTASPPARSAPSWRWPCTRLKSSPPITTLSR